MKQLRTPIGLVSLLVALAACRAAPPAAPTLTPAPIASPAPTLTLTPLSSDIPSFTDTPILPTPSFPAWGDDTLLIGELFFGDAPSGCELPCWQDLIIGKSGPEDIQSLFDTVFGFNGTLDFFADNPIAHSTGLETSGVSGIYDTGYIWYLGDGGLSVVATLDENTMKLEGLILGWSRSDEYRFRVDLNPAQTIRRLGTPSYTLAGINGLGTDRLVQLTYLMIYDKGMVFDFYTWALVDMTSGIKSITYCLDNPDIPEGPYLGEIVITEPLVDGLDNLSPFQMAAFGRKITWEGLVPVEDVFDVTGEEVTRMLLQGDTCLSARIE